VSQHGAFLSYTSIDNEFFGGAITSLRKFLELGVQVVTGNPTFKIFQDIDGIEFGQKWQQRLDEAVTGTTFFIPIMTPLFFQSTACRNELETFVKHEKSLGRQDLILPIYFVTTPLLEKADLLGADLLASEINSRQRYDWRPRADLPINDTQVRGSIKELCEKISSAIARVPTPLPPNRDAALQAASNTVKSQEPPKLAKAQKRILWVDDKPNNTIGERKAMEAYHVDFTLALSTEEALEKLRASRFDAIISDMGRPPDSRAGYTLLGRLRASGNLTPFFICSSSNAKEHVDEALSLGAQGSTNSGAELIADVLKTIGLKEPRATGSNATPPTLP
jgi:CheY-like chemotaxis protein